MNRLLRLLLVTLRGRRAHRRAGGGSPLDTWRTPLRVMPNDLDVLRHMNNGSYLTLMDLGRVDMVIRSGAQPELNRRGWYPVVVGESIRFRRSLNLWERFEIVTRLLGWDERVIYLEQSFERRPRRSSRGDVRSTGTGGTTPPEEPELVATAWVAARFLARSGGSVPSPDVAALFSLEPVSPEVPADVLSWARSLDLAHRPA